MIEFKDNIPTHEGFITEAKKAFHLAITRAHNEDETGEWEYHEQVGDIGCILNVYVHLREALPDFYEPEFLVRECILQSDRIGSMFADITQIAKQALE